MYQGYHGAVVITDIITGEKYQGEQTEEGFTQFLKEKCGGGANAVAKKKKLKKQ